MSDPKTYIAFQDVVFRDGVTIAANAESGNLTANNLLIPVFRPGWMFATASANPGELQIDLASAQYIDYFAVDKSHTMRAGNVVKIYFSNISSDPLDAEDDYTITVQEDGKPIIQDVTPGNWRYAAIQFDDNYTTPLDSHTINFIYLGPKERFDSTSLSKDSSIDEIQKAAENESITGNLTIQRRSDNRRAYDGTVVKVTEADRTNLLRRLIDQVQNGWPFLFCFDDATAEREREYLKLVQFYGASDIEVPILKPYEHENEQGYYSVEMDLREVGQLPSPYSLPDYPEVATIVCGNNDLWFTDTQWGDAPLGYKSTSDIDDSDINIPPVALTKSVSSSYAEFAVWVDRSGYLADVDIIGGTLYIDIVVSSTLTDILGKVFAYAASGAAPYRQIGESNEVSVCNNGNTRFEFDLDTLIGEKVDFTGSSERFAVGLELKSATGGNVSVMVGRLSS